VQLSEKKAFDRNSWPERQSPPRPRAALLEVHYCGISHHYTINMAQGQARRFPDFVKNATDFVAVERGTLAASGFFAAPRGGGAAVPARQWRQKRISIPQKQGSLPAGPSSYC
jgi:hypothetical protein